MYPITLLAHSYLRWVVIGLAIWSFVRNTSGLSKGEWTKTDDRISIYLLAAVDLQLLLGLLLYFVLSPVTAAAFADMKGAMKTAAVRFWAVEHLTTMLLAVAALHIARSKSKKAETGAARHKIMAIGVGFFLLFVFLAYPWPWTSYGRPWIR